jgi:putative FmdB family regulatory protein
MPLYEYKCSSCGHQQEFLQKWSDTPLTVCTACGKETFTKMLTAAGFQLKGSGWYATDFKNTGTKAATGKPAASAGDAAKSDAKPASEGESKKESSPPASGTSGTPASS